jgi:hypothetical protein
MILTNVYKNKKSQPFKIGIQCASDNTALLPVGEDRGDEPPTAMSFVDATSHHHIVILQDFVKNLIISRCYK